MKSSLLNATIGEYRLVDFLGAGGMGEVYRGVHAKLGRVAAIKVLSPQVVGGTGFFERFFNEARIQASLQHPNIATLYDFLEFAGQPCIIMEYVDGESLCERLRARGPLPLDEALEVFRAVAAAVAYTHRCGVIHRDIKSSNIKVNSAGQVKLLDFGIAKGQTSQKLTATGSITGTLLYISPEQLQGNAADVRSEIWALGVLFYEMVTGQVPFYAENLADLCDQIRMAKYTHPQRLNPAVSDSVSGIIARCLRREPAERYQTVDDVLRDVERATPRLGAQGPDRASDGDPGGASPSASWLKRHWVMATAGAASAAVIFLSLALGGLLWLMAGDNSAQTSSAGRELPRTEQAQSNVKGARSSGEARTIRIDVDEGRAEVFRSRQRVGTTPYDLETHVGERVNLVLRREGYADREVSFDVVASKRVYTFSLQPK